jgi:phosphate starvation-inducible PhoH-like protein
MGEPSARLELQDNEEVRALTGGRGENLKLIERRLAVQIGQRGNVLLISGAPEQVLQAQRLLAALTELVQKHYPLQHEDVEQSIKVLQANPDADLKEIFLDTIITTTSKRPVTPKGFAQKAYIEAIRKHDIVFGIGPAGTGKTYLAMAMAVAALVERRAKRIVLCRPAVEAGEKLGFLDEAQNTTTEQMKMFLTRLGFGSKAVVTGDLTQIDLPMGKLSGLNEARQVLQNIEGIKFCEFSDRDVVRHPLVQEVVRAYESHTAKKS